MSRIAVIILVVLALGSCACGVLGVEDRARVEVHQHGAALPLTSGDAPSAFGATFATGAFAADSEAAARIMEIIAAVTERHDRKFSITSVGQECPETGVRSIDASDER